MKCGEFDKRNLDYSNTFSSKEYFRRLILGKEYAKQPSVNRQGKGKIIFDVGAHRGESATFFHKLFPDANIYSFEPNYSAAKDIIDSEIPNVMVHEIALSNYDGSAKFNIQDISHLSSLHNINQDSSHSLGYAERERHTSIDVEVARGDTFMKKHKISEIDLLKIDVQANEVETIQGFSSVLNKIRAVFVEVSMYDFYNSRSSIRLIEESLPNFELFDIYEISKNPKTLGTDWATMVYTNQFS